MRACKCVCEHVSLYSEPRHHSDNYDQRSIMESHPTLPSTLSSSITEAPPTTTGRARVSSAEDTPKNSQAATNGIPRKKKSFINPFDPSKVHMEDSSHQHRWMHAFPRIVSDKHFRPIMSRNWRLWMRTCVCHSLAAVA